MGYLNSGVLLSHENEWNNAICSNWMDLETILLSKISQTEKEKHHMTSHICEILKDDTNELIYKTEVESQR